VGAALTATVRSLDPPFTQWCLHHLGIVDRILLWIDDPGELDTPFVPALPEIEIHLGCQERRGSVQSTMMHRQDRNAARALKRCSELKIDWLIHLDSDELLYCTGSGQMHDVGLFTLPNHEVCPRWEAADPFRSCHYFKVNGRTAFWFYSNGKSAVRVSPRVQPWSSHRFRGFEGREEVSDWCCVLHYSCATFERWVNKYRTLGAFSDYWRDHPSVPIEMPFHLASRDVYRRCAAASDFEAAATFFRSHLLSEDALKEALASGTITRLVPLTTPQTRWE
jgi:hypothetical protein